MAWGDADRRTLYLAAETRIYRIRLNIAGAGALPKPAAMANLRSDERERAGLGFLAR